MLRLSFRSPESVEMDEIMAAMVLTSLSGSPVVQSPPQMDPGPGQSSFTNTKLHHQRLAPFHLSDMVYYQDELIPYCFTEQVEYKYLCFFGTQRYRVLALHYIILHIIEVHLLFF